MSKKVNLSLSLFVIPLALLAAYFIYYYVLGQPGNFVDGDPSKEPINNNFLGVIYKGGPIVILLISFQLIMLVYVIERFIAIRISAGKGNLRNFVGQVKSLLDAGELAEIQTLCNKQKGAVANVVKTGIGTYMSRKAKSSHDQKDIYLIQKELEESTQLELPILNKNMFILSTIAQIATLVGLLGTVTGMIKAFGALASVGEPDPVGLAGGISQALVTTALGISTAAVTIVFYNFFANKIEKVTYAIDEASFSIIHSLKLKYFSS
jgi:biopolymer transport protein ExbB